MTQIIYLFLDVDGVLNKESDWKTPFSLDRSCVKALADFAAKTKWECRIVLISTWRAGVGRSASGYQRESTEPYPSGNSRQYDRLCRVLEEYGLSIYDTTPISDKGRQAEVEFYIRRHQVEDYIVIDDDLSMYDEPGRLVFYAPDYRTGFTREDVKKALKQLWKFKKR